MRSRVPSSGMASIVALVALALGAAQLAAAATAPVASVRPGSETAVTRAPQSQRDQDCFGSVVVWEDDRNSGSHGSDIWMRDLATGVESRVTQSTGNETEPAIFGDLVIWTDDRDKATSGTDIWMKDLGTGVESPVTQAAGDQRDPVIFGDLILWTDGRDQATSAADIWMLDLGTGVEEPVTQAAGDQAVPDVYGDIVVWDDYRDAATNNIDIWMRDLATGVEAPVVQQADTQRDPSVYGDTVVWSDSRDFVTTSNDIWGKDLADGSVAPITQSGGAQREPEVFGSLVAWEDTRDQATTQHDVWMKDLATGTESPVSQASAGQYDPSTYGRLVGWQDGRDFGTTLYDIYAARIDGPATEYVALEGPTRYETAAAASRHAYRTEVPVDREGYRTVVLATGRNWPDALGASALAGVLDAPVLITQPDYVPAAVRAEIARLDADRVIFAGGDDVVTPAVQTELAAAGVTTFERLAGPTRYETADAVAYRTATLQAGRYDGTVFVATGLDFPDALAAAPVAAAEGWPIFLAGPAGITQNSWAVMQTIGVKRVHILGGPGAVPSEVEQELRARFGSGNVTRQMGPTRYETAVAVARFGVDKAGLQWDTVAIATGEDFPDALCGGAVQARTYSVLLLTRGESVPPEVSARLSAQRDHIARLRYLGGTDVVTPDVRGQMAGLLH